MICSENRFTLFRIMRYAAGGTEILIEGRSSIFWWNLSSFG
jgi:hypothetical protein